MPPAIDLAKKADGALAALALSAQTLPRFDQPIITKRVYKSIKTADKTMPHG